MPTYTYQCKQCQALREVAHGMDEEPRPACLICGGFTRKLITRPPSVIHQTPEAEPAPADPDHDCHSGCVLHRKAEPKPENPPS